MWHTPAWIYECLKSLNKMEILLLYPGMVDVVKKPQWWAITTVECGGTPLVARNRSGHGAPLGSRGPGLKCPTDGGRGSASGGMSRLEMFQIVVNGESRAVSVGTTVAGLLADLGLEREHVAVEANREIVPRAEHEARVLSDGDTLEIVTFVGGG